MLVRTYVYRLRTTRAKHAALDTILTNQRHLYNAALEERSGAWRNGRTPIGFNDQTKSLTSIRSFDAAYGGVPYNVSKWTLKRLDDAFKAFFRRAKAGRKPGFPRFRSSGRWSSFGFHQKDGLRLKGDRLLFSGGIIGALRLKMHRPLPDGAVIKSAVFTKEAGIWRVALTCHIPLASANDDDTSIGIDVGVENLATDSTGRHYANIRPGRERAKRLRRAQRALARCRRGSNRRLKMRMRLAREQRALRNARVTHLHDVANAIVRSASTIFVEDLRIKNMTRSAKGTLDAPGTKVRQKAGLNRALADTAPGRLISMIAYKAESAGGRMIKVDPRNTSKTCSSCGTVAPKALSVRRHVCSCGADMHRDHNAAINILERGIAAHGAARRPGEHNVADCRKRAPGPGDPLAESPRATEPECFVVECNSTRKSE